MTDETLTFDDVLCALKDMAAGDDHVQVFIGRQSGPPIAAFGGRLRQVPGPFTEQVKSAWDDDDLEVFYVDGGQDHERLPCFAISPDLFDAAAAVTTDELEAAGGLYWRGLSIFIGGIAVNVAAEFPAGEEG